MLKIYNLFLRTLLLLLLFSAPYSFAETIEYPSLVKPGTANIAENPGRWTFSNNLFSASFVLHNGKLFFDGSPEMNLATGTEIFQIVLGNGTKVNASQMTWGEIKSVELTGNSVAQKYSERQAGKALIATLTYNNMTFKWRALLRDGSHYLRTELEISTSVNTPMTSITPMLYKVRNKGNEAPVVVGNTRGAVVASDNIFAGLETPLAFNSVSGTAPGVPFSLTSWTANSWNAVSDTVPRKILNLGFTESQIVVTQGEVQMNAAGSLAVKFQYTSGTHRMNLAGVDIVKNGVAVASDYHIGYTGGAASNNTYTINVPAAGQYTLRYFGEVKTETITSAGSITLTGPAVSAVTTPVAADSISIITGKWSRSTTLQTTDTFKVSSVIGLVAQGQKRRSFLAYHERERAVPWRSFVLYNSWYELDINVNNNADPLQRMLETQCLPVVNAWKTNLYDPYGVGLNAFVWDDGWDDFNSLWNFHIGFPNGFSNVDASARQQGSGTGAWLGPVGGYGSAKAQRLAFWNSTHTPAIGNFQLSNKEYFDAFVGRCGQMVNDYDMRFFKFDGISTAFSATGPANEEDAEGIVNVLKALRKKRNDLFFNCTVGTWASPFWFQYADAVWRQENDFDQVGNQGNAREKWITYRDRLVYQNFVSNSPLCPINSLMTHGLIVTKNGPPATMPRDNSAATLAGIKKEMRCAFACGSGMVELYVDYDLMSSIGNKALWKELADCIKWHRANKDVLADVHWVGGSPWDGTKANVYGWAAWSPLKSTLALRNPSTTAKTYTTTLRQALDIPAYITGSVRLSDAFAGQTQFAGITNTAVDIDASLSFNLPAFDVVVFNGAPADGPAAVINPEDSSQFAGNINGDKAKIVFKNIETASSVRVVDMKGQLMVNTKCVSSNFTIPVPHVGVYVVQILSNNGQIKQIQRVVCE